MKTALYIVLSCLCLTASAQSRIRIALPGGSGSSSGNQPLENQRLSTTNSPAFAGLTANGLIRLTGQSGTPSAPTSGTQNLYADSTGAFTLQGANGFAFSISKNRLTANHRVYVQNKDYTVADSADVAGKQATLVSGTTIKTVNGNSLLGSGDIVVSSAGSLTLSSASTLTLAYSNDYVFNGTTATYTLPAIDAAKTGRNYSINIKNRGTGALTINTAAGSTMYGNAAIATYTLYPGEAIELLPDGQFNNLK
jgi:hypothetical protein